MTIIKKAVHVSIETDDGIRASIRRANIFSKTRRGKYFKDQIWTCQMHVPQKKNLSQHITQKTASSNIRWATTLPKPCFVWPILNKKNNDHVNIMTFCLPLITFFLNANQHLKRTVVGRQTIGAKHVVTGLQCVGYHTTSANAVRS
jgi:hypothetical protein